jgi:DNA phosphorothioation-dependent restriction protein DptG
MFFFVFLFLSILGEYIGRLLEESTHRPMYFIMEEEHSSVLLGEGLERNVLHASQRNPS